MFVLFLFLFLINLYMYLWKYDGNALYLWFSSQLDVYMFYFFFHLKIIFMFGTRLKLWREIAKLEGKQRFACLFIYVIIIFVGCFFFFCIWSSEIMFYRWRRPFESSWKTEGDFVFTFCFVWKILMIEV